MLNAEPPAEVVVDQVVVDGLGEAVGPRFGHGIRTPLELKVPWFEHRFPYASTLAGVHIASTGHQTGPGLRGGWPTWAAAWSGG
ncbi:hypothetical protein [Actinoplanes aureus]|uniref:Uncharacterized protein n=1 Tax=Actinoplanes aureus TaxID=2792083 RepID=A0A931CGX0_9ACTN|nr:hypothetical protein [Actinoplanes aureus]MBG0566991.1 hypothetical protein [Actinoplanes aureus]